jgi:arsenate reductase (thioredoxin)
LTNFYPYGEGADLLPIIGETHNILFVCSGNSARSIMAEALLNHLGRRRFRAFSAGSDHRDAVHPVALEVLASMGFGTMGLYPKSYREYLTGDAPRIDRIVSVCENAELDLGVWPGRPALEHWEIEDPALASGRGQRAAFFKAFRILRAHVVRFIDQEK